MSKGVVVRDNKRRNLLIMFFATSLVLFIGGGFLFFSSLKDFGRVPLRFTTGCIIASIAFIIMSIGGVYGIFQEIKNKRRLKNV